MTIEVPMSAGDTREIVDGLFARANSGASETIEDARLLAEVEHRIFGARDRMTLRRYVLLRPLGRGSSGVVYLAYDPELDRKVALKLLYRPGAATLREAQALACFSHPNVVTIHDVATFRIDELVGLGDVVDPSAEDGIFLVMEHVEGQTLAEWLSARHRRVTEIAELFASLGRGVAAAHDAALVHCDLKPRNVLVGSDGRPRVADFGLAMEANGTRVGQAYGTPAYMAPEQHDGGAPTPQMDQYAFCTMLYEALTGRHPFAGVDVERLAEAKRSGPPPVCEHRIPRRLRTLLRRGLDPSPERRFPDMHVVVDHLAPPGPSHRWRLGLGAVLVGIGTGVVAGTRSETPCGDAGASVDAVWNSSRRQRVERVLEDAELDFARHTGPALFGALDRHAAAWQAASEEACVATRVRHERSEHVLDLGSACLDRRLGELDALLDRLELADAASIERAVEALETLRPPEDCLSEAMELAGLELPHGPEMAAAIERERRQLGRVRTLLSTGDVGEARREAEGSLDRAEALGYAPLRAEAELELGRVLHRGGHLNDAATLLRDAYAHAVEIQHSPVARDAAIAIAWTESMRADYDRADEWTRQAEAWLARLPSHGAEAALARARAEIATRTGRYDDALAQLDRASELRRAQGDRDALARIEISRGAVYQHARDDARAVAAYEQARAALIDLYGPDHPSVATVEHNLGVLLDQGGEHEAAVERFERCIEIWNATYGEDHPTIASAANNLGIALARLGRWDRAIASWRRAIEIWERTVGPEHPDVARALANIGITQLEQGRLDDAFASLSRAEQMHRDHLGSATAERGLLLRLLGNVERQRGHGARASALLEQSATVFEQALGGDHVDVGRTRAALADSLVATGSCAAAGEQLRRAEQILATENDEAVELDRIRAQLRSCVDHEQPSEPRPTPH